MQSDRKIEPFREIRSESWGSWEEVALQWLQHVKDQVEFVYGQ